jgi:hypothetical protein
MGATLIKLALSHHSYRRSQKQDARRQFNCDTPNSRSWHERAALAGHLLDVAFPEGNRALRLFDLGCGDTKLRTLLAAEGRRVDYVGYDLLPQSPDVSPLDLARDDIPGSADVAVVLGVFEYLPDTVAALTRIRRCAPWLIVSHAATDVRKMKPRRAKKLNWQTYVSTTEFERRLDMAGYQVVDRRITPDSKTCVWLCQAGEMHETRAA